MGYSGSKRPSAVVMLFWKKKPLKEYADASLRGEEGDLSQMELEEIDKVNRAMWRWRSSITAWALEGPQHTNPVRSDKGYLLSTTRCVMPNPTPLQSI